MHPLLQTLGGIGLFLYGMGAMTSGLQKLAGKRLRHWLSRSTGTPLKGAVTGATATAVVQSSSAITVAAVGFVGAGLLSFEQTLGVIFGANIGTTITGWMVALLGFKLKLSTIALPLLFVAAILYLFKSHRRLRGGGKALAGFCLIFLGISYLQQGLADYRGSIDLGRFGADHLGTRFLLVVAGGVLTLITQSSSASVATALTALNASVLTLPQAAAVIIGADIGTTVTAAFATIGGSTASRRTGFAHVIYNLMTGVAAFLVLPAYLWAIGEWIPEVLETGKEVVAVSFHTAFNTVGVILALPFTKPFARLIIRLFPERDSALIGSFEQRLLQDPGAATEALAGGTEKLASTAMALGAVTLMEPLKSDQLAKIEELLAATSCARDFALKIGGVEEAGEMNTDRLFASLHLIDHVERLGERLKDEERASTARSRSELAEIGREVSVALQGLSKELSEAAIEEIARLAELLERDRMHFRSRLMASATASGELSADQLDRILDSHRWLRRLAYHGWRAALYQKPASARQA